MTPEAFALRTAGIAYQPRGVFLSELYLFASSCVRAGVTTILESGVGASGFSTRILRALWPDRVRSCERYAEVLPDDLRGSVTVGNGRDLIPAWVKALPHEAIGVFVDGPKGQRADDLRAWCLAQPQVRVFAQHDIPEADWQTVHSHHPEFRRHGGDALDATSIDLAVRAKYPRGGPGLGVWVRA